MPLSKTRKPQLAVTKDIGELFDCPDLPVKLRQDLYVLTRHQRVVINKLRAQVPEAKNSDARNAIQEITDLLIHRNNQTEKLIEGVLDRKIQVYHKARKIKAEARMDEVLRTMAESFQRHEQLLEMLTRTQAAQVEASQRMASQHIERATRQTELRVEGLKMPKYYGRMDESFSLYIHQVTTFFKAKNVDYQENDGTQQRCIAMMVANFRDLAAAWYQERLSRGESPNTLIELEEELRAEFEPDDLQDRLRDQLYELKQAHCASLTDTREELQYRRCETVTLAIQVALDYERSHNSTLNGGHARDRDHFHRHDRRPHQGFQDRHQFNNRHQVSRPPHAYPPRQRQDDDMEAPVTTADAWATESVTAALHPGTIKEEAKLKPQFNNNSRHANQPQRPQRNTPSRQQNAQVTEVNSNTEDSEDDVEEVILGNNMDLAQQDSAEEESLNINTAQQASQVPTHENKLMIVHGALDSASVRILIDSGASNLLCRPGLAKTVIRSKEVQAEGFDVLWHQESEGNLILTEWDLGKKDFDVILGKPWFFRYNPAIGWCTHQILNRVNSSEVEPERIEGWMIKGRG
ncbi:hypothetical protein AaE_007818 [Aphanomyces astaci]|uniref:Retrotransposon gag domain-containing protein n=1 Tax=Aphanomyces astaci TaxID=112090 RepID=A0A6A5AGW5_APHAT|nr:hypothetical protein AaE_007818 [Aphanomyces astaci]